MAPGPGAWARRGPYLDNLLASSGGVPFSETRMRLMRKILPGGESITLWRPSEICCAIPAGLVIVLDWIHAAERTRKSGSPGLE